MSNILDKEINNCESIINYSYTAKQKEEAANIVFKESKLQMEKESTIKEDEDEHILDTSSSITNSDDEDYKPK